MINFESTVTSLATDDTQAVIHVKGQGAGISVMNTIFSSLAAEDILVDMISHVQTPDGIYVDFSLGRQNTEKAVQCLIQAGFSAEKIRTECDVVKINIEGLGMEKQSGVAAQVFAQLEAVGIPVILVTTSETQIQICTSREKAEEAEKVLAGCFGIGNNEE